MKFALCLLSMIGCNASAQAIHTYALNQNSLKSLQQHTINMDYSRAYLGTPMTYQTVSMKALLTHWKVNKAYMIELIAKDNFSVYVPAHLFFQTDKKSSVAYLAIEPKQGWPILANGTNSSAGPFQIIWTNPRFAHISDEYWAWSITAIAIHKTYPLDLLIPPPKTNLNTVLKGHQIYVSHCASCHTINHIGKAVIGPDLGGKNNPLKRYPLRANLKAFIRNPNQFRKGRMSGSSLEGMTDKQLQNLINYFDYIKQ